MTKCDTKYKIIDNFSISKLILCSLMNKSEKRFFEQEGRKKIFMIERVVANNLSKEFIFSTPNEIKIASI